MVHINKKILILIFTFFFCICSCEQHKIEKDIYVSKSYTLTHDSKFSFAVSRASVSGVDGSIPAFFNNVEGVFGGYPGEKLYYFKALDRTNVLSPVKQLYFSAELKNPFMKNLKPDHNLMVFVANCNPDNVKATSFYGTNDVEVAPDAFTKIKYSSQNINKLFPQERLSLQNGNLEIIKHYSAGNNLSFDPSYTGARLDFLRFILNNNKKMWKYQSGNFPNKEPEVDPFDQTKDNSYTVSLSSFRELDDVKIPLFGYADTYYEDDITFGRKLLTNPEVIELKPRFARFSFYIRTAQNVTVSESYLQRIPRFFYIFGDGDLLDRGDKHEQEYVTSVKKAFDEYFPNKSTYYFSPFSVLQRNFSINFDEYLAINSDHLKNKKYNSGGEFNGQTYSKFYDEYVKYPDFFLPAYQGYYGPYFQVAQAWSPSGQVPLNAGGNIPIVPYDSYKDILSDGTTLHYTNIQGGHHYKVYLSIGYSSNIELKVIDATTDWEVKETGNIYFN